MDARAREEVINKFWKQLIESLEYGIKVSLQYGFPVSRRGTNADR